MKKTWKTFFQMIGSSIAVASLIITIYGFRYSNIVGSEKFVTAASVSILSVVGCAAFLGVATLVSYLDSRSN